MIILLCFPRGFKRNMNIKCKPFGISCMTNHHTRCACVRDMKTFYCFNNDYWIFGGLCLPLVSLIRKPKIKKKVLPYARMGQWGYWHICMQSRHIFWWISYLYTLRCNVLGYPIWVNAAGRACPYTKNSYFGGYSVFPGGLHSDCIVGFTFCQ